MTKFITALILCAASASALAGFQDSPAPEPQPAATQPQPAPAEPAPSPPRTTPADAAAMESAPYNGVPGKSRVERRREKCAYQAGQQGLSGEAFEQHMQGCVKR